MVPSLNLLITDSVMRTACVNKSPVSPPSDLRGVVHHDH